MSDNIQISRETAEKELNEFLDFHDVDQDDEANKQFKDRLIRAMVDNRLEFQKDEDGDLYAVQTTKNGSTIEYKGSMAQAKIEMGKYKNNFEAQFAFLGVMTKEGADAIKKLGSRDAKIADCISVFLAG